jgi:hypothetical protein
LHGSTSKFRGDSGVNSAVKGCGSGPEAVRYSGSSAVQFRWASRFSTPAMSGAVACRHNNTRAKVMCRAAGVLL